VQSHTGILAIVSRKYSLDVLKFSQISRSLEIYIIGYYCILHEEAIRKILRRYFVSILK